MAVWGGFPPWDDASFFHHAGVSLYLPLPMSCCVCPPLSQRGKGTHTQCRRVVLAGNRRPTSIWRPWHLWLPGWLWRPQPRQFWRSRDSLGPGVSWRSRWQLWNPLSGKLLGPRRQWRVFQLGHQRSGTVTTRAPRFPPPALQAHILHSSLILLSVPTLSLLLSAGDCGPTWLRVSERQQLTYRGKGKSMGRKRVSRCVCQKVGEMKRKERLGESRYKADWTGKRWAR